MRIQTVNGVCHLRGIKTSRMALYRKFVCVCPQARTASWHVENAGPAYCSSPTPSNFLLGVEHIVPFLKAPLALRRNALLPIAGMQCISHVLFRDEERGVETPLVPTRSPVTEGRVACAHVQGLSGPKGVCARGTAGF